MEQLPNELCDEIASYLKPEDCVALGITNRRMCASSLRHLYRNVSLEDMDQAMGCFRTLAGNSSHAQLVISLNILLDEEQPTPDAFIELVEASTANLERLQRLIIPYSTAVLSILSTARFPCLSHCRILPCQSAVLLLQNNPSIRTLSFQDKATSYVSQTHLDPICLPLLDSFIGPHAFVRAILPHSRQTSMSLFYWISDVENVSLGSLLSTLQTTERVPKRLALLLEQPDLALLSSITPYLATVESLSLYSLDSSATPDALYELLDHADKLLSGMPNLFRFNVTFPDNHKLTRDGFEREFDLVRRWEAYAPNLSFCMLPSGVVWCSPIPHLWMPDPRETATFDSTMPWYIPLVHSRGLKAGYQAAIKGALDWPEATTVHFRSGFPDAFGEDFLRWSSGAVTNDDAGSENGDDDSDSSNDDNSGEENSDDDA
ncbi:hypothetical protein C8F01DRAFT_1373500 [Mycena amicta]|nr:hypothetical protein C8F01DRAFT_1373500 [Mycena amicta]